MSTTELHAETRERLKGEWLDRLQALVEQVKGWAIDAGWRVHEDVKSVTEPALGKYKVPLLFLERGGAEFVLSPLARPSLAAEGVVDVYLMPGYDDVVSLECQDGRWTMKPPRPEASTALWRGTASDARALTNESLMGILGSIADEHA